MGKRQFSDQQLAEICRLAGQTIRRIIGEQGWQERQKTKSIAQLKAHFETITDNEHYSEIVWVIFCQHTKSKNVEARIETIRKHLGDYRRNIEKREAGKEDAFIEEMMNDKGMFRSEKKMRASIDNAFRFEEIVKEHPRHGEFAFRDYILGFDPWRGNGVDRLVEDMARRFTRFRRISAQHFLVRYGFPLIKPDSNIKRTFFRIGLVADERDGQECIHVARQMAAAAGVSVPAIDGFVFLGMKKGHEVCGHEPKCHLCDINPYCRYSQENAT